MAQGIASARERSCIRRRTSSLDQSTAMAKKQLHERSPVPDPSVVFDLMECFQGHDRCCLGHDKRGDRLGTESQDQKEGVQQPHQGVWIALDDPRVIYRVWKASTSFLAIRRQAGRWTDPAWRHCHHTRRMHRLWVRLAGRVVYLKSRKTWGLLHANKLSCICGGIGMRSCFRTSASVRGFLDPD